MSPPVIVSAPVPPVMVSAWLLPVMAKASVWPLSVIVTPAAALAAEIASTPWIEVLVAPSVLRSAEVEVRLIVSPVPEPRLMVPEPMRIASSWAPVSVTVSVPEVPVRLPVSTSLIASACRAPRCRRSPRHSARRVPPPRSIVREARPLRCRHRHGVVAAAAGQRLDARDRADREVDRGAHCVSTIGRVAAAAVGPPWIDSPETNWPLARLIVSSPPPASIVSAPRCR